MPLRSHPPLFKSRTLGQFPADHLLQGRYQLPQFQHLAQGPNPLGLLLWPLHLGYLADQKFHSPRTSHTINSDRLQPPPILVIIESPGTRGIPESLVVQEIRGMFVILETLEISDHSRVRTIRAQLGGGNRKCQIAELQKVYRENPQDLKEIGRHIDQTLPGETNLIHRNAIVGARGTDQHLPVSIEVPMRHDHNVITLFLQSLCPLLYNWSRRARR